MQREAKVGLLVLVALAVLAAGIFFIGEKNNLFSLKNHYFVRFKTARGLAEGNPVQLNGVTVGRVESIVLPEDVDETLLTVWITVDRRYTDRVRQDSVARIKTLGLLGDKYIDLTSGSAQTPKTRPNGEISAAPATDVDKLLASGGDVVENVVAISYSLRAILSRMEAGEGILGELTTDSEAGRRAKETMLAILDSVNEIIGKIENGQGTLAKLINDPSLADAMTAAVARAEHALGKLEDGEGALPALLNDPATRQRVEELIDNFGTLSESLTGVADGLKEGGGLLGKLLADEEYGKQVSDDLKELIHNLNELSEKLESGEGTVGQLINDPSVYEALNDVIVGINESRLLRWLVRNRQKAGIRERYEQEHERPDGPAAPPDDGLRQEGSGAR